MLKKFRDKVKTTSTPEEQQDPKQELKKTSKKKSKDRDVKPKKKRNFKEKIKSLDALSWFFIIITLLIVGLLTYIAVQLTERTVKHDDITYYYDENLNFSIDIPSKWGVLAPDDEEVVELVNEATGGVEPFSFAQHSLAGEVVPLALIQEPQEDSKLFSKFVSFAFRGSDSEYSYLKDKVKLMDDFRALLKNLEHEDISVDEVKDIKTKQLDGILLSGSGTLDGVTINYFQYFEIAGKNTLILTYGTTSKPRNVTKEIGDLLSTLTYLDGLPIDGSSQIENPLDQFSEEELEEFYNDIDKAYEEYDKKVEQEDNSKESDKEEEEVAEQEKDEGK